LPKFTKTSFFQASFLKLIRSFLYKAHFPEHRAVFGKLQQLMTGPAGPNKRVLVDFPARMWEGLLASVRQEPPVRQERVAEVRRRLASGEYLTAEAAACTAALLAKLLDMQ
jgi:hypothetical protein